MTKLVLVAALLAAATTAPVQAHPGKAQHRPAAASYPDSVTLDEKQYKVCKPGMEDDCVQPHQAGLGHGDTRRVIHHQHHHHHPKRHR